MRDLAATCGDEESGTDSPSPLFEDLKARFLRLRSDSLSDGEANAEIDRLSALGARRYRELADAGAPGFDPKLCSPKLGDDLIGNERLWCLTWRMITAALARQYPSRLAEAFGAGAITQTGSGVYVIEYPASRWRQRCEDYVAACDLLDQMSRGGDGARVQVTPRYDVERRELWVSNRVVKVFRRSSSNQETVLKEFQDDGWPRRLWPSLKKHKIRDTVKDLNEGIQPKLIRFGLDGTGGGILWKLIPMTPSSPSQRP